MLYSKRAVVLASAIFSAACASVKPVSQTGARDEQEPTPSSIRIAELSPTEAELRAAANDTSTFTGKMALAAHEGAERRRMGKGGAPLSSSDEQLDRGLHAKIGNALATTAAGPRTFVYLGSKVDAYNFMEALKEAQATTFQTTAAVFVYTDADPAVQRAAEHLTQSETGSSVVQVYSTGDWKPFTTLVGVVDPKMLASFFHPVPSPKDVPPVPSMRYHQD
jgi:hypothetical protein